MDSDTESPKKRLKTEKITECSCIFCDEQDVNNLTKPKDVESWKKLLKAACLQKYDKLTQFADESGIPDIEYHSECRKTFVHKKALSWIENQETEESALITGHAEV